MQQQQASQSSSIGSAASESDHRAAAALSQSQTRSAPLFGISRHRAQASTRLPGVFVDNNAQIYASTPIASHQLSTLAVGESLPFDQMQALIAAAVATQAEVSQPRPSTSFPSSFPRSDPRLAFSEGLESASTSTDHNSAALRTLLASGVQSSAPSFPQPTSQPPLLSHLQWSTLLAQRQQGAPTNSDLALTQALLQRQEHTQRRMLHSGMLFVDNDANALQSSSLLSRQQQHQQQQLPAPFPGGLLLGLDSLEFDGNPAVHQNSHQYRHAMSALLPRQQQRQQAEQLLLANTLAQRDSSERIDLINRIAAFRQREQQQHELESLRNPLSNLPLSAVQLPEQGQFTGQSSMISGSGLPSLNDDEAVNLTQNTQQHEQHQQDVDGHNQRAINTCPAELAAHLLRQQQALETRSSTGAATVGVPYSTPKVAKSAKRNRNKDLPKRPLSAYNLFFKDERARMMQGETDSCNDGALDVDADAVGDESKMDARAANVKEGDEEDVGGDDVSGDCHNNDRGYSDIPRLPRCSKKIGFQEMVGSISKKWKELDSEARARYQAMAQREKKLYDEKKDALMTRQKEEIEENRKRLEATVGQETRERYLQSIEGIGSVKKRKRNEK